MARLCGVTQSPSMCGGAVAGARDPGVSSVVPMLGGLP